MVKRNPKKEIVGALTKELEACGFPTDERTREWLKALREGRPIPGQNRKAIEELFFGTVGMLIKRGYKTGHIRTDSQLDSELQQIEGLRRKLRPALAQVVSAISEALPPFHKPRGPKPKLTDTEKQSACSTIDTLRKSGMTIKFAIEQTAKQYKANPRTIRRAWERHGR